MDFGFEEMKNAKDRLAYHKTMVEGFGANVFAQNGVISDSCVFVCLTNMNA